MVPNISLQKETPGLEVSCEVADILCPHPATSALLDTKHT
jgi:hypothetical protein